MILWAVNENRINEVREILRLDADTVNAKDNDGYTPLHRAAYNNFVDMAKLLLQYRADPNARTELGWTPLHSACKWNNADCAHLLLQFGADVNAESEGKQTPLHITATVSNCRNTATVLLLDRNILPRLMAIYFKIKTYDTASRVLKDGEVMPRLGESQDRDQMVADS